MRVEVVGVRGGKDVPLGIFPIGVVLEGDQLICMSTDEVIAERREYGQWLTYALHKPLDQVFIHPVD